MKATVELIKVTPEMAESWLSEKWHEQRNIRPKHVAMLAQDMTAGKFSISPDAILRVKGKLANGQHRLSAVIESGKPQTFIVLESNDDELYKKIDLGLRRRVSDSLIGVKYAKTIPSIARWVIGYDAESITQSGRHPADNKVLSPCAMIEYCEANVQDLGDSAKFVGCLYEQTKLMPESIAGALHFLGHRAGCGVKMVEFLQDFFIGNATGVLSEFKNRMIANRGSKAKLHGAYILALAVKTFNAHVSGKRLGVIKWESGEPFPKLSA